VPFIVGILNSPTAIDGKGKIAVIGSVEIFNDEYFEKEENCKLFEFLMKFFFTKEVELEKKGAQASAAAADNDYTYAPDVAELSEKLKSCLQESEELPRDFTQLFDINLFKFDTDHIPESIQLYEQLKVKHEQLNLIVPQFETPLLGLQPAVFPPIV
jgi:intraflagellar transport protein 52